MLTFLQLKTAYPALFKQENQTAVKKSSTFTKSKGGWQCGKSFIPKKNKCYTDPVSGKKLKEPTTVNAVESLRFLTVG